MEGDTDRVNDRYAKLIGDSWWAQFRRGSNPWMARYVYGLMFLIANLLAWGIRDYGRSALSEMKRLKECQGGEDCLGAEGVLRVSLGCCIFYFVMFLCTAGTKRLNDRQDLWHSGRWPAKVVLIISLILLPFFVPSAVIQIYGDIAHFGAGVFLMIQLVSIISFITWLNDRVQSDKLTERCHIHVMLLATSAYVICICGIILMFIWYAPQPSCLLNIFFITWTLVLLQLMTSVSLHPKVNAGFLTPGLMGLYVVFLCWSAVRSEPPEGRCMKDTNGEPKGDWLSIISFIIAVIAMVIATFSTGIDSKCFQFKKDEPEEEDEVPYGYGFFHFVFATGAMYFAMLLISWNTKHVSQKWTIDVGWTSTWVRIVNEWLAACIYIWMVVAPVILKHTRAAQPPGTV